MLCYSIYMICTRIKRCIVILWKKYVLPPDDTPFWVIRRKVPFTTGLKVILATLILMGCFLFGWNILLVNHNWEHITRYTQLPFFTSQETTELIYRRKAIRNMFKDRVMQTIMVLGDYTPLSYLAISSLLRGIIDQDAGLSPGYRKENNESNTYPFIFIGSSTRMYQERRSSNMTYHAHYGIALGEHKDRITPEDMLYQWIDAIVTTSIWSNSERINLTEVVEHYGADKTSVRPMIFIDFDVISALCITPIRQSVQFAPGTKLFALITPRDDDRIQFTELDMYSNNPRCICLTEQCKEKTSTNIRNASILFGGSNCLVDRNGILNGVYREKEIQSVCLNENNGLSGDGLYEKCCSLDNANAEGGCYSSSSMLGLPQEALCKWKYHTISLSKQRRLFNYIGKAFHPKDMFVMDLESYLDNPIPLEREFAQFLSLPLENKVSGRVEGDYKGIGDKSPRICLKEVMRYIAKYRKNE